MGTGMEAKTSRRQHRLKRVYARQLETLVGEEREAIESGRYTQDFFAKYATGKLGFMVTVGNVMGASRVVGVSFQAGREFITAERAAERERRSRERKRLGMERKVGGRNGVIDNRTMAGRDFLDLQGAICYLAHQLVGLQESLGVDVPEWLSALAAPNTCRRGMRDLGLEFRKAGGVVRNGRHPKLEQENTQRENSQSQNELDF